MRGGMPRSRSMEFFMLGLGIFIGKFAMHEFSIWVFIFFFFACFTMDTYILMYSEREKGRKKPEMRFFRIVSAEILEAKGVGASEISNTRKKPL